VGSRSLPVNAFLYRPACLHAPLDDANVVTEIPAVRDAGMLISAAGFPRRGGGIRLM
jgi:hypothetical protein